jgi:hypothetical protein
MDVAGRFERQERGLDSGRGQKRATTDTQLHGIEDAEGVRLTGSRQRCHHRRLDHLSVNLTEKMSSDSAGYLPPPEQDARPDEKE